MDALLRMQQEERKLDLEHRVINVFALGLNDDGRLGLGEVGQNLIQNEPFPVPSFREEIPHSIVDAAAGNRQSVFCDENGKVYWCGKMGTILSSDLVFPLPTLVSFPSRKAFVTRVRPIYFVESTILC